MQMELIKVIRYGSSLDEDLNSENVTTKMENTVDENYEHDDLFNIVNIGVIRVSLNYCP